MRMDVDGGNECRCHVPPWTLEVRLTDTLHNEHTREIISCSAKLQYIVLRTTSSDQEGGHTCLNVGRYQ